MKKKEIPIIYKGRQVTRVEPCYGVKQKVYDMFWKIYMVKKVYHPYFPTERIVIE